MRRKRKGKEPENGRRFEFELILSERTTQMIGV
jgi:hypothetical protein